MLMSEAQIYLKLNQMPLVQVADQMFAEKPFLHADRQTDFHVLIYVIQGSISVVESGTEYEIGAGDIFFLKARLHHYGVTPSAPDTRWIYVHFLLEQSDAAQEPTEFNLYASHLQGQEFTREDYEYTLYIPKLLHLKKGGAVESKLYHLVEWFHSSNPLRVGYMNPLLQEILVDCYMEVERESVYPNTEIIYEIIQDLENHTRDNFDSGHLEETFHLSYKHLCRIFKQATGRTLTQYHTELRINEASRLLRETTNRISDISSYMGFADPLYFSNVFKKVSGFSPRGYRQQYMADQTVERPEEHAEAHTEAPAPKQEKRSRELESWLL